MNKEERSKALDNLFKLQDELGLYKLESENKMCWRCSQHPEWHEEPEPCYCRCHKNDEKDVK